MRLAPLTAEDAAAASRVHRASFDERLPWLSGLHTPAEDAAWWRDHLFATCRVWGAFEGETLNGVVAFRDGFIEQLYVLPGHQGQGAGGALLEVAKRGQPSVRLSTFQKNAGARSFYENRGFVAIQFTDRAGNEEREPDVLYEWIALRE